MLNNFGLDKKTTDLIINYFKQISDIEKVKIFGSRAQNTYRSGSDIDFAIWFNKNDVLSKVTFELNELPLPYKFDIIDYNNTSNIAIKENIDKTGIIFYKK